MARQPIDGKWFGVELQKHKFRRTKNEVIKIGSSSVFFVENLPDMMKRIILSLTQSISAIFTTRLPYAFSIFIAL